MPVPVSLLAGGPGPRSPVTFPVLDAARPYRSLVGKEPIDLDMLKLAFRVLAEAVHPDLTDVVTAHPNLSGRTLF